jgi:hypothetical protein
MEQKEIEFDASLAVFTQNRINLLRKQWILSISKRKKLEETSTYYILEHEKIFTSTSLSEARADEMGLFCDLCDYLEWFDPFCGIWHLITGEDKIYREFYKKPKPPKKKKKNKFIPKPETISLFEFSN